MPTKSGSLISAVAYYRMSTKKQDASIPAQRIEVERYAEQHGYRIIRWKTYVDEGISGSEAEKREGFQRLIADATQKRDFEVILCWDQDRFSRFDPLEANHYWFMLRQAGVRIVTVRQGELDLNELAGWLVASINQHGKAQYLKDLSANVLRGRLRKAEKGLYAGSRAPYGYSLTKDGQLALGPQEHVDVVKWIFREYTEKDTSLRQIAITLNRRGIPSPSGGKWSCTKVVTIVRREAYTGSTAQFTVSKGKFNTIRGGAVAAGSGYYKKDPNEWFRVSCPQIIDRNLWELAQSKMRSRRKRTTPVRGGGRGLLNGLLFCGHCGARMMSGAGKPLDSSGDVVYCCSTYNTQGKAGCYRNMIHQAAILPHLLKRINEQVFLPANDRRFVKILEASIEAELCEDDTKKLRQRLKKLDEEIKLSAAQLKRTPDDLYDLAVADLRELRQQRTALANEIGSAAMAKAMTRADSSNLVKMSLHNLGELRRAIESQDPQIAREAMLKLVERIDMWFTHKHGKVLTRSYFHKAVAKLRRVTDLCVPAGQTVQVGNLQENALIIRPIDLNDVGFEPRIAPAQARAISFIQKVLAGGPVPASEIYRMSREEGIARSVLHKSRIRAGVQLGGGLWTLSE